MTDKKITDEEIIKALECCSTDVRENICPKCAFYKKHRCSTIMLNAVSDLINRQKSEIERLKECPKCVYEYDGEVTEYCIQGPCSNFKTVEQIKSEAYKEFAKELKNKWFDEHFDSPDIDFDGEMYADSGCEDFTERSEWVHLPCKFLTTKLEKYPKYEFTTAQINLPNGEVYKVCDICGEKCKSNMGIEIHFRTIGHCGFINRGFCHKCSKKYEKLIAEFFDKLADKGGANG